MKKFFASLLASTLLLTGTAMADSGYRSGKHNTVVGKHHGYASSNAKVSKSKGKGKSHSKTTPKTHKP